MKQIADNCGIDGAVVADEVSQKPTNIGYDANTGEYVDMFKAGIIDPVKVVRSALQNAASIAGLMLTTEALVTNARQGRQGQEPRRRQRPLAANDVGGHSRIGRETGHASRTGHFSHC